VDPVLHNSIRLCAASVVTFQVSYYDAESFVVSACRGKGYENVDHALAMMHTHVMRYQEEVERVSKLIRDMASKAIVNNRPPAEIKSRAEAIDKYKMLSADELREILRDEYRRIKLNHKQAA